ncbi:PHP domain-containing protein [Chloroflexota bacterium]
MMPKIDLHIHSCISDGRHSPAEVVRKSAGMGMTLIAITDHDNVDAIVPALEEAENFPGLTVVPGVEISTEMSQGEVHMLGYFIDYTNPELVTALENMRNSRKKRGQEMIDKLVNLGLPIEWERVQEIAGYGSVGRPHIAQALLEKGYITSLKDAFTEYLGWGKPAYASREKVSPAEAVRLILGAQGLPVLAHPLTINDPEALIIQLKGKGLVGLEAYYGEYDSEEIARLASLADKYDLITTGGSDYHGLDDSTETLIGNINMPPEVTEQLIALVEQRAVKSANTR